MLILLKFLNKVKSIQNYASMYSLTEKCSQDFNYLGLTQ